MASIEIVSAKALRTLVIHARESNELLSLLSFELDLLQAFLLVHLIHLPLRQQLPQVFHVLLRSLLYFLTP